MNRGTMRAVLRRRLDDPTPVEGAEAFWTDGQLDEALNLGAAEVGAAVLSVDPLAFLSVTQQNIEADLDLYPKPQNAGALLDLRMKDTSLSPPRYRSLGDPVTFADLDVVGLAGVSTGDPVRTDISSVRWAFFGRFIKLAPIPVEAVTNGLEWYFIANTSIESGEDHDTEAFQIHLDLHNAIILKAFMILAPEMEEKINMEEVRLQYREALEKIPASYRRTVGRELPLRVLGLDKVTGSR